MTSRRKFLFNASATALSLTVANMAIYSIGSALKQFDGSLVAGAKSCSGAMPNCNNGCTAFYGGRNVSGHWCERYLTCNTTTGNYSCTGGSCLPTTFACP